MDETADEPCLTSHSQDDFASRKGIIRRILLRQGMRGGEWAPGSMPPRSSRVQCSSVVKRKGPGMAGKKKMTRQSLEVTDG